MTTPKFTPGPWEVTSCVHPRHVEYTVSGSGWIIARLTNGEHNANLVASAPALYAALAALVNGRVRISDKANDILSEHDPKVIAARAALALALGEKGGE